MKVKEFQCGSLLENGYVAWQRDGGSCLLIDPGYRPPLYIDFVREHQLAPAAIILTHLHEDHTGASARLADVFSCPRAMHERDAACWREKADILLKDGDLIPLEGETLRVLATPGHTPGSICLLAEKSRICFSGDTLFDTDLGRTDLEGGSEEEMEHSIRTVLNRLENDIYIYPGHEGGCTMKQVRAQNEEFKALTAGRRRSTEW